MQLVGLRLTAIANIGTHLLYRDGFAIGDLSSLLTCLWDLCSLGNEFVCGVICNEVHDRTAICAALVISDFFIGRAARGAVWRETFAELSSASMFLKFIWVKESHPLPRTDPLIFLRVVLPVCRTGIALSTSECGRGIT